MGMITLSAAREQRKTGRAMETSTDGAASQERDHERPRRIREAGRIIVTVGEAVYVLWRVPTRADSLRLIVRKMPTLSSSSFLRTPPIYACLRDRIRWRASTSKRIRCSISSKLTRGEQTVC